MVLLEDWVDGQYVTSHFYTSWEWGVQCCVPGWGAVFLCLVSSVHWNHRVLGTESISCSSLYLLGLAHGCASTNLQNGKWADSPTKMFRFEDHDLMNAWGKIEEILSIRAKGPWACLFIHLFNHALAYLSNKCLSRAVVCRALQGLKGWIRNAFHLQGTYSLELNVREKEMVQGRK